MPNGKHHPEFDFSNWEKIFPIEFFERTSGPRRSPFDDSIDLWKPSGRIVNTPAALCSTELVRRAVSKQHDLGRAMPIDVFLWRIAPPDHPYLTKLGGVPHREGNKPWPTNSEGEPYTFVGQFCFLDSLDLVSDLIKGDVLLVFMEEDGTYNPPSGIHLEWSNVELKVPTKPENCPPPSFMVPELSGVIYRCFDYPDSRQIFRDEGYECFYWLDSIQASKICRKSAFIQVDQSLPCGELFCTLCHLPRHLSNFKQKWPFVDLEELNDSENILDPYNSDWGKYTMSFGDAGSIYFFVEATGNVAWSMQSY